MSKHPTEPERPSVDETAEERARKTEPVPSGETPPSQSGYGHTVPKHGRTKPQGGGNPIGPEPPESAGRKGRTR